MKRAVLFAGQGAEEPRMGVDLYRESPRARELIDHASRRTGVDVLRALERGGSALERTNVLQPALVAVSLGAWAVLRERGVRAQVVAGHSLGELSAWSAAGGIDAETAIDLAATRGDAMSRAASERPGGMLALTDADEALVARAITAGEAQGTIAVAAQNSAREWVLSGDARALDAASRLGASRRLAVDGAWHSPAMDAAIPAWRAALERVQPRALECGMLSGVTGALVDDANAVTVLLERALTSRVRWNEVMSAIRDADEIVIAGPGKVLRALVRKNLGASIPLHVVDDAQSASGFRFDVS